MTGARGAYHSVQGRICSGWHWDEAGRLYYETVVPAGTTARLELPQAGLGYVYVDGLPATAAPGVYPQESEGDDRVYRLGSGRYAFCVCPPGVEPAAAEPMFQGEAPGLRVK